MEKMKKSQVTTNSAPAAIGPYSQGVKIGNLVFTSGQLPINPVSGNMSSDVSEQTRQSLENVKNVLIAAGSSLNSVVKVTVFLKNMGDFAKVNEEYGKFFTGIFPARSCIEVARLPKDALVEIEAIAAIE